MKCRIRKITAPRPSAYEPLGSPNAWSPMVLEVVVEVPKSNEEAEAQFREAEVWAYPRMTGFLVCSPIALELDVAVAWPTCARCLTEVRLNKLPDGFMAECHLCGAASDGPTIPGVLAEFAREFGPKETP